MNEFLKDSSFWFIENKLPDIVPKKRVLNLKEWKTKHILKKTQFMKNNVNLLSFDVNGSLEKIIEKHCNDCENIHDYENEYYIGVYGINQMLEDNIINFVEIFSVYGTNKNLRIYEEYLGKQTLYDFLKKMLLQDEMEENEKVQNFLKIFLQLVMTLEYAQQKYKFCHYDLHLHNIMVIEGQMTDLEYDIFEKRVFIQNVHYICKIIDFGYSTLEQQNVIFGRDTYFMYGIYPFLIPGVDMLKIMISLYYMVLYFSESKISFKIKNFLSFIFCNFYGIFVENIGINNVKFLLENYCNLSMTSFVFKNTLELIYFLSKHKEKIKEILGTNDFPIVFEKKDIKMFMEPVNIRNVRSSFVEDTVNTIFIVKLPTLSIQNLLDIKKTILETAWFVHDFEILQQHMSMEQKDKRVQFLKQELISCVFFYRVFKMYQFYFKFVQFLLKEKKIDHDLDRKTKKYVQKLNFLLGNRN